MEWNGMDKGPGKLDGTLYLYTCGNNERKIKVIDKVGKKE